MKKTLLLCLAPLLTMLLHAQKPSTPTTLEGWAERLGKFGTSIPQEQVFVHTDNTCYFLGDTLYYKAYVRRGDTGVPSRISGVLYAELLNQDGYLMERQQLELHGGQAHGSFVLPDTLYAGYYELRAYTRWQLNWGVTEHPHTFSAEEWFFGKRMAKEYYRDYEKLYSRVFPVFDKPKEPGDFYHEMTLRPLRRSAKTDDTAAKPVLRVYPEGGNLVAGVPCRVGFEVATGEGLHLEGHVVVKDGAGQTVAEADVEQRGRGSFTFVPQAGKGYNATFTGPKGTATLKLPKAETDGCAVQVNNVDGQVTVQVASAGTAATQPLGMTVMHEGVLLDSQTLPQGSTATVSLDRTKLRTGICQVTIYNNVGRVYADRLFFHRGADLTAGSLRFRGLGRQPAEPFAPVSFTLEGGKPNATVSVSVCDATHSEYLYDDGDILTEMLLASQIRGFVENPRYFFEKDDEEHNRALDLLLMVQGWRRYEWHTMTTPGAFVLNHRPEQQTPQLVGEVNRYMSSQQESQYARNFEAINAEDNAGQTSGQTDTQKEANNQTNSYREAEDGGSVAAARELGETDGREIYVPNDDRYRSAKEKGEMGREVLVHALFTKPGSGQIVDGEMMTEHYGFSIPTPRFFEKCYFQLGASDSTKWKGKKHIWTVPGTDANDQINYPEFYVRLLAYFPRFVKPYNWYQCHLAAAPKGSAIAPEWVMDGSRLLDEITVGVKRERLGRFDATKPAYVIDAYAAFNDVCDAGICPGVFYGSNRFARDVARTYIGDMNLSRDYEITLRLGNKRESNLSASQQARISTESKHGAGPASMPVSTFNMSANDKEKYNLLKNLSKVYIYTDYSPRREGNSLFEGEDIPGVEIDLRLFDNNDTHRATDRDRRYILPGFSAPEEFYQPDYSNKPLPEVKDYRRTLYWNPDLKLDADGNAELRFYGNGKQTHLSVRAEGMADDGTLLTGKSMPEDR